MRLASKSGVFLAAAALCACSGARTSPGSKTFAIYDHAGQQLPDDDASSSQVDWVVLSPDVPGYLAWNGVGQVDPGCTATLLKAKAGATAPAYLITAGHCSPEGEPGPEEIIVDRATSASASLGRYVSGHGSPKAVDVDVDRIVYATMKGTDVMILRVASATYAELTRRGVHPLEISPDVPTDGEAVLLPQVPLEGVRPTGLRLAACTFGETVDILEDGYASKGLLRNHCSAVGGTSGAPVVDKATSRIVGLLTTGSRQLMDGSPDCSDSRPCEVSADGTRKTYPGENYAQHVYQVAACFAADGTFDLDQPGCGLEKP